MKFDLGRAYCGKDDRGVEYCCLCSVDLALPEKQLTLGIVLPSINKGKIDIEEAVKGLATYNDSHGLYDMTKLKNVVEHEAYDREAIDKIAGLVNQKGDELVKNHKPFKKDAVSLGYIYRLRDPNENFIVLRRIRGFDGILNGGWIYDSSRAFEGACYMSHFALIMRKPQRNGYMKLWDYHIQRHVFTTIMKMNPHEVNRPLPFADGCIKSL